MTVNFNKGPSWFEKFVDQFDSQQEVQQGKKEAIAQDGWIHIFRGVTSTSIFAGSCIMCGALATPVLVPVVTGLGLVAWQLSHTKKGQELKRAERAALKATVGKDTDEMKEHIAQAASAAPNSSQLEAMRLRELNEALDKLQKYALLCHPVGKGSFDYADVIVGKEEYRKALVSYEGTIYYEIDERESGYIDREKDISQQIDKLLNSQEFKQGKITFFTDEEKESQKRTEFAPPSLKKAIQKKKEKLQKYIDVVKAYGVIPDAKFYANGGKQKELNNAYQKLDPWCRHNIGDTLTSLEVAITNSIRQGFEKEAREEKGSGNPDREVYKDEALDALYTEMKTEISGKKKEVWNTKESKWDTFSGSDEEFTKGRIEFGSCCYRIVDSEGQEIGLTEAEKKFIEEKKKKLQPQWDILKSQGGFQGIPGVAREKAVASLKKLGRELWAKLKKEPTYSKMLEDEKKTWICQAIYASDSEQVVALKELRLEKEDICKILTGEQDITKKHPVIQECIPGDMIVSKVARYQVIEKAVKQREFPSNPVNRTPAEKLYIQNGGDVSKWDGWKFGANIIGTGTKSLAGLGSIVCLGFLIEAAPIIGTCGALVSLPYALAYGRNVVKSWQNTVRQGVYLRARGKYHDF